MSARTAEAAADSINAAPEEGQSALEQQEVDATASVDASHSEEVDNRIPEKFVGKSPQEIIRSYTEAEKTISRLGSEKAQREKEAEDLRQRLQSLEVQFAQRQQQPQYAPQPVQRERDPEQILEEKWMESPLEAVREGFRHLKEEVQDARKQGQLITQAHATAARWEELKRTNPEAPALEADMVQLSQQFAKLVPVEHRNTPEMVDALYMMAKGRNQTKFVEAEVEKRLKKSSAIKQEKRSAFSESSNSQGETSVDFESLTLDQMRKMLPRSDK